MKQKTVFVLAMVVAVLCCAGYCNAEILGTIEHSSAGTDPGEFNAMDIYINLPFYVLGGINTSDLSLSWNVTPDDVGKTFFASDETHMFFYSFADGLTNGIDSLLYLSDSSPFRPFKTSNDTIRYDRVGYDLTGIEWESTLISGIHDGVDFEGYTIDSIALTVNELFLDYLNPVEPEPVSGLVGIQQLTTDYSYDITYTIYGAIVPEPCTLLLFGIGGLVFRRRRKV